MVERRTLTVWKFILAAWAGAWIAMYVPQLVFGPYAAGIGTVRVLIPTAAAAVGIAWALWMAVLAFRHIDEYQREAGKFAWYWGGAIGVAVSLVGYMFLAWGGLHWLDPAHFGLGKDLLRAFNIGYALAMGSLFGGFLVARLVWEVTRR